MANPSQIQQKLDRGANVQSAPKKESGLDLFEIGKPTKFHPRVDPKMRVHSHIKAKMNVIDLIPCHWKFDLKKAEQTTIDGNVIRGIPPTVDYDSATEDYATICKSYGLKPYKGIRLFITDDTTTSDSFSTEFSQNYLQDFINNISGGLRQYRDIGRSLSSEFHDLSRDIFSEENLNDVEQKLKSVIKSPKSESGKQAFESVIGNVKSLAKFAADIVINGNRVEFPRIWNNTSYSPNLTAVVKLVSPYGHPKAVKEFIIKPLMYLIILASPRTRDGVSFGSHIPLTVKAYGLHHSLIATIKDITFRRGGSDTSFNIYKQPLSVDVSISFERLTDGFAIYTDDAKYNPEKNLFSVADKFVEDNQTAETRASATVSSLANVLASLRPTKLATPNYEGETFGQIEKDGVVNKEQEQPQAVARTPTTEDMIEHLKLAQAREELQKTVDNIYNQYSMMDSAIGIYIDDTTSLLDDTAVAKNEVPSGVDVPS